MTGTTVVPIERLELRFAPRRWRFADERRAEIDEHFAKLRQQRPAIWNGRILLMSDYTIADGLLRGSFFESDYASFLAWRDWGFPDSAAFNGFSAAAVRSADGAFVLGTMGAHTASAGTTYFPCGTPDHFDIAGDAVDFTGNIRRELAEETGLDVAELSAQAGWCAVLAGPRIALIKLLQARQSADELDVRIRAHLARDPESELADIRTVRGPADLDPSVPQFVVTYLHYMWQQR